MSNFKQFSSHISSVKEAEITGTPRWFEVPVTIDLDTVTGYQAWAHPDQDYDADPLVFPHTLVYFGQGQDIAVTTLYDDFHAIMLANELNM